MTSKVVRVDGKLFERVRNYYENQAPAGANFSSSQIANMALSHSLGMNVDVIKHKKRTLIKCY